VVFLSRCRRGQDVLVEGGMGVIGTSPSPR